MIGTAAWVIQKKSTIEATTITQNWKKMKMVQKLICDKYRVNHKGWDFKDDLKFCKYDVSDVK